MLCLICFASWKPSKAPFLWKKVEPSRETFPFLIQIYLSRASLLVVFCYALLLGAWLCSWHLALALVVCFAGDVLCSAWFSQESLSKQSGKKSSQRFFSYFWAWCMKAPPSFALWIFVQQPEPLKSHGSSSWMGNAEKTQDSSTSLKAKIPRLLPANIQKYPKIPSSEVIQKSQLFAPTSGVLGMKLITSTSRNRPTCAVCFRRFSRLRFKELEPLLEQTAFA